jgi:hypothetical protein
MKTTARSTTAVPVLSMVPASSNESSSKVIYGLNGYSRIKEIFAIRPLPARVNMLETFLKESEKNDPNWFSSYE